MRTKIIISYNVQRLSRPLQLIDIRDRSVGEAEEHLARMGNGKDSFIFAAFVFCWIDGCWVDVAKVDLATGTLWDRCGEDDLHPIVLHTVTIGPDALNVSGVSKDCPRNIFEPVPLAKEVVTGMVAHLADQFTVRHGDLG